MRDPIDRVREAVDEQERDRRVLSLLILLLLVSIGTGIGTIAFDGGPNRNNSTETPTPVELTPVTPTPDSGGGEPPAATPTEQGPGTAETPPTTTTPTDADNDDSSDASSGGSSGSDGGSRNDVDLQVSGSDVFFRAADITPGSQGRGTITFENAGSDAGRLDVTDVTVVDDENSLLDPEVDVGDDAATGELSSVLDVRLAVTYPDGVTEYYFGGSGGYVSMASLDGADSTASETIGGDEQVTVTMAWELPSGAGNVIQSDSVEFDVEFRLEATS